MAFFRNHKTVFGRRAGQQSSVSREIHGMLASGRVHQAEYFPVVLVDFHQPAGRAVGFVSLLSADPKPAMTRGDCEYLAEIGPFAEVLAV